MTVSRKKPSPQATEGRQVGFDTLKGLIRPDEWAVGMDLKVDGRPFSLLGREYIRQVIRDYSPEIVIPKAAQMAFTVTFLTKSLHSVTERRLNGLYLLPLKTGAVPFVQARIDPIIESNPALATKFGSVDNRLHKQSVDGVNLYIRGTNILRELQEVPVDFQIWDERDHMVEDNLPTHVTGWTVPSTSAWSFFQLLQSRATASMGTTLGTTQTSTAGKSPAPAVADFRFSTSRTPFSATRT